MFCKNDPCENEAVPESGKLHLCQTCYQAWQCGFQRWTHVATQVKTYHIRDSLLIRLPKPFDGNLFPDTQGLDTWPPPNMLPFQSLFEGLPPNRISYGFLELGEWSGEAYEKEFQLPFLLGPDGKVWAEIGEVDDLPPLAERDREALAAKMIDEFLEICDDGEFTLEEGEPTRAELCFWPVPRVMHWLQRPTTLRRAAPAQRQLIQGLLRELKALGFQPKP
ncbi:MAG: hypothetical protein H6636_14280 [Anaerolineales bacterium]|nr:hypothetical protein [Anaerolineales bacterium]